ncbi:hypothetical protein EON82_23245 [bacterium]|nr:MAG: hypothetical protein EON82_23245 [bacterium]
MFDYFQIIDRKQIAPQNVGACRKRLNDMCGESRMVRLGDSDSVAREVWESIDGQKFTIVFRLNHFELQEIAFGGPVIEVNARPVNAEDGFASGLGT